MNKRHGIRVHVGASSILLIFVILCLVSFAVLSLSSAEADLRLTSKVSDRTSAYYEACNKAESNLASINETCQSLYCSGLSEDDYFSQVGHTKSFSIEISDLQTLSISLRILYPDPDTANDYHTFYQITSWKVLTDENIEYDETLPVVKEH